MATERASLPELLVGQGSKELTHNEALRILEALTVGGVVDRDLTAPPGSPTAGSVYIPKTTATGAWAGKENQIAHFYNGSWKFYPPQSGWHAWIIDEGIFVVYAGGAWSSILLLQDPAPNLGTVSGSVALNIANSGARATIGGNTTFSFSGSASSGYIKGFLLQLTNGGSAAITWPASVKWPGGVAPLLTPSGVDFLTLITLDGGTTWNGSLTARDSR